VRRFLPELIELIWSRRIDPAKVFDLSLPLEEAAEGYRAMDQRRAIKTCCGHTVDGHVPLASSPRVGGARDAGG
jgi:hypothetical protein